MTNIKDDKYVQWLQGKIKAAYNVTERDDTTNLLYYAAVARFSALNGALMKYIEYKEPE